jgi:hypothetical protein
MVELKRAFDIDDFRALMQRKGVARNNLYKLHITPSQKLKDIAKQLNIPISDGDVEDIMLYCESVTLPGVALATIDSSPYGYGPRELKAYAPIFTEMSASFIVDAKGYTLSFFRNWLRSAVNYTGEGKAYHSTNLNGSAPFEASYKRDYECNMELYVVSGVAESGAATKNNLNLELVNKTTIVRAFPRMIGDVVMSYGVNDQYLSLPVSFSYFEWYGDSVAKTATIEQQANGAPPNAPVTMFISNTKDSFGNQLMISDPLGNPTGISQ